MRCLFTEKRAANFKRTLNPLVGVKAGSRAFTKSTNNTKTAYSKNESSGRRGLNEFKIKSKNH